MSWDTRKRGDKRGYYYRSVRRGDQVEKVYVGRGPEAEEAAREIDQRQADRQAQREAMQAEVAQLAAADEYLRELQEAANLFVSAVLTDAGYHKRRGEWRKRKHGGRDSHGTDT